MSLKENPAAETLQKSQHSISIRQILYCRQTDIDIARSVSMTAHLLKMWIFMTSVAVVAGTRWRKVLPLPTRQMAYKSCSVHTHTRSLTCMGVFLRFKLFANFLLYLLFEFLAFWPFLHSSPVVAQLCHSILQVVAKVLCAFFI